MSYTPPLNNAVIFNDTAGGSYTPPGNTVVIFNDYDVTTLTFTGIPSAEAFGTPSVVAVLTFNGIVSAEAFGTPSFEAWLNFTGIPSGEAFGTPSVTFTGGGAATNPSGIYQMHMIPTILLLFKVWP